MSIYLYIIEFFPNFDFLASLFELFFFIEKVFLFLYSYVFFFILCFCSYAELMTCSMCEFAMVSSVPVTIMKRINV